MRMQLCRTKFRKSFILSTKKWNKCFIGKNLVGSRENLEISLAVLIIRAADFYATDSLFFSFRKSESDIHPFAPLQQQEQQQQQQQQHQRKPSRKSSKEEISSELLKPVTCFLEQHHKSSKTETIPSSITRQDHPQVFPNLVISSDFITRI